MLTKTERRAEALEQRRFELEESERREKERAAWRTAGLSFWRLVWIVAFGILIAQGIAALAVAVFRALGI